ncbi:hypothetical protein GBW32_08990 [Streptomyces tsukubensis]|uniref:Uncharacterized protein n=1 Tax=Streptomyces tsukubensis TaxID=83656 RepID=A0A1V4A743_9ACTN|nr:hypothetical protein B1H18_18355 [Streptomyces tsukubensis]QFR93197.1 hypothetical protein GBW32_08990 [Streptomyces tsukubensis]
MPSLTVVVSSDTDICFSPGLYGDCLPTFQPAGPRIHSGPITRIVLLSSSCSHTRPGRDTGRLPRTRHIDTIAIVKVT